MTYPLTIRSPTHPDSDFTINVDLQFTILQLKQRLQNEYFDCPKIQNQRLICAGKLRTDDETMEDVFGQS
ncbi:hypothetical protein HK097_001818, partial [Rhizophlyctis rosea]